jgi:hypothetical protein
MKLSVIIFIVIAGFAQVSTVPNSDFPTFRSNLNSHRELRQACVDSESRLCETDGRSGLRRVEGRRLSPVAQFLRRDDWHARPVPTNGV